MENTTKTSLHSFCKTFNLPKSSVHKRSQELGIITKDGLTAEDCDRLKQAFNVPTLSLPAAQLTTELPAEAAPTDQPTAQPASAVQTLLAGGALVYTPVKMVHVAGNTPVVTESIQDVHSRANAEYQTSSELDAMIAAVTAQASAISDDYINSLSAETEAIRQQRQKLRDAADELEARKELARSAEIKQRVERQALDKEKEATAAKVVDFQAFFARKSSGS